MEIKFEISDELFNETFKGSVESLSNEQKADIIKQGLLQYVQSERYIDDISKIMFDVNYYNKPATTLTRVGKELITNALREDEEINNLIVKSIKDTLEEKGSDIVKGAIADIILQGFMNNSTIYDAINYTTSNEVYRILNEESQNNRNY